MKKLFILILVFFILILLELACYILINPIQSRYNKVQNFKNVSDNIKKRIINVEYKNSIPYLRDKNQYDDNKYIKLTSDKDYLFNELNQFSEKNNLNILIQGDSLGESLNMKNIFEIYSNTSKKNNFGLINSSISSYSITPHYFQIKIMYDQFNINPNIVVMIFDQTDIGDELYRYNIFLKTEQYKLFEYYNNKILLDLNKNNFNFIKIILFLKNFYLKEKNRYNFSNFKNIKNIFKKIFFRFYEKTPVALTPLIYGIDDEEKFLISKVLENYINTVFVNKKVDKLFFIIQPTKKHTTNEYKLSNRLIIKEAISNSKYKNQIELIDFFNKPIKFYEFVEGDLFSHPTEKYYKTKFWPTIFDKILNY